MIPRCIKDQFWDDYKILIFDAIQVAKTLLSARVSSTTVTWDVAPLCEKLDHIYIY